MGPGGAGQPRMARCESLPERGWRAAVLERCRAYARQSLPRPLAVVTQHLTDREGLLGAGFSVADAYLWWALTLLRYAEVSLEPYPSLRAFYKRHRARPAVQEALRFEFEQHARAFQPSVAAVHATP